jgi:Fe2+ transport system protein FeoA
VLRLIRRRPLSSSLPVLADSTTAAASVAPAACALTACIAGSRATILEVRCGDAEACRLRALGLCEGASVDVVRSRDCTLLEVRGARLALGAGIAAGITVLPVA